MLRPRLPDDIFQKSFAVHRELLDPTEQACREPLERLATLVVTALRSHGKILLFGNGGSAADAQHLAAEFTIRFIKDRRALAAIALTTDTSALTACGNDLGFDRIFSRQIEALGRPGDVAIGISTSGNSPSVIGALEIAQSQGMTAAALSGRNGGRLQGIADPLIVVPSDETARIQEMHILLGHILCAEVEHQLGV
jgi:D-sedoheptulose 7-phosphate isomerase